METAEVAALELDGATVDVVSGEGATEEAEDETTAEVGATVLDDVVGSTEEDDDVDDEDEDEDEDEDDEDEAEVLEAEADEEAPAE